MVGCSVAGLMLVVGRPSALAENCVQPARDGCLIGLNQSVAGVLGDADNVHVWQLNLTTRTPFSVVLSDLSADYDLHVSGPDGALVAESTNDGPQDDTVEVTAPPLGTYVLY